MVEKDECKDPFLNKKRENERRRYPSWEDPTKTEIRVVYPALIAEAISGLTLLIVFLILANQEEVNLTGISLSCVPFISTIIFGILAHKAYSKRHSEIIQANDNQILFGKLLTVNKVRTLPGNTVELTYPEMTDDYYGELHFLGKYKKNLEILTGSDFTILTQAASDLLKLAKACQNDSPWLEGINVFIGPYSTMITPRLEKLGFEVREPVNENNNLFDIVFGFLLYHVIREQLLSKGIKIPERDSMSCLITRENLIQQIPKLERIASRRTNQTS